MKKPIDKIKARELMMKSKLFRMIAILFAGAGFAMFISMLYSEGAGDLGDMIKNPGTILVVLVPFLPAVVLSVISSKMEADYKSYLKDGSENKK